MFERRCGDIEVLQSDGATRTLYFDERDEEQRGGRKKDGTKSVKDRQWQIILRFPNPYITLIIKIPNFEARNGV